MKILILGFTKIKYMPYLNFYLNQINTEIDEVGLLYWLRDNGVDSIISNNIQQYRFNVPMEDSIPLWKKIPMLYKYRIYAKKVIKEFNPDFLIILHTTTGVMIKDLLCGKYKKKYILDYRDLTYENLNIYKKMVHSISKNSSVTFTSSDGFRNVLPENCRIYTSHNIDEKARKWHLYFNEKDKNSDYPIRIGFWGLLRHYDINKKIIEEVGKDKRFELHYYGRAQGRMKDLMSYATKEYDNIYYHGEYLPEDKYKFARNIDLLHNIYDDIGTIKYAMGNKYYDGIVCNIPQLCFHGTYMAKQCVKKNLGMQCNPYTDSFCDDILKYYNELNYNVFKQACNSELKNILNEVEEDHLIIRECIK